MQDIWNFGDLSGFAQQDLTHGRLWRRGNPGNDPVLLMVHGGYHGAWCWFPWMRRLEEAGIASAAVDLRGHAGLPQGPDYRRQGIWNMAEDVTEAARKLGGPVILVGHSLGALIAMAAARDIRPCAMLLLAPSPPGQLPGLQPLPAYLEDELVQPPDPALAREKFLRGFGGDIRPLLSRLCAEPPVLMNDRYLLRVTIDAGWIDGPVLCLSAGLESTHLHPPGQDEATAGFFGGTHRMLPASAHDMMLDSNRDRSADLVADWYRSICSRTAAAATGV